MRAHRVGCVALCLAMACVRVQEATRIERGPLLRTFERESVEGPGGLRVRLAAEWPVLTASFTRYDLCRKEKVEEYAEEHVTEKSSPATGPGLATGITATLIGSGLLLARGAFSNAPDTRVIDAGGHYGASDRQVATGWGIGFLIVGVPALATGIIGAMQSGEKSQMSKGEQVISSMPVDCREAPVEGQVEIATRRGPLPRKETSSGKAPFGDAELRGADVIGFSLAVRGPPGAAVGEPHPIALSDEDQQLMDAFLACTRVLPQPDPPILAQQTPDQLEDRLATARRCLPVHGAPAKEEIEAIERALQKTPPSPAGGRGPG